MFEIASDGEVRIDGQVFGRWNGVTVFNREADGAFIPVRVRGCHFYFENGFVLSAQWGSDNDCGAKRDLETLVSDTAEVALFVGTDGPMVGGWPCSYIAAKDFLGLVATVRGLAGDERSIDLLSTIEDGEVVFDVVDIDV